MKTTSKIEITKESGEIVFSQNFLYEIAAQSEFDTISKVRSPRQYQGMTMNLSEYPVGRIGSVRLVVENTKTGDRYMRRELYRKP